MKPLLSIALTGLLLPLVSAHAQDSDKLLATVNDSRITASQVDSQARQLAAQGQQASQQQIVDELINLEVMQQEALKQKLDELPDVASELKTMRARVLANALLTQVAAGFTIEEADLKKEYERQVAENRVSEYLASHILLEDEARAAEIIAELNDGADFAEAAKKYSTGPSGPNGGDLGWFAEGSMVPEFSAAVAAMEPGNHSSEPVKTQFGFHIIKLMDKRNKDAQPFEAVAEQLRSAMIRSRVSDYIGGLRNGALIEMHE
jgi:peptidyl-prolyl cis-trans isomerase C